MTRLNLKKAYRWKDRAMGRKIILH